MNLRVLHIVPIAPDGGTSSFTQQQIDSLAKAGIEGRMVFFRGFTMLFRPHQLLNALVNIRREIQSFRPNIVHAHWGSLLAFVAALATICGPPLLITFRGSDINPTPSQNWLFNLIRVVCSQLAILRASAIICVSSGLRERFWLKRESIRIIPDGTDVSLFKP
jgi:hypothetical protein